MHLEETMLGTAAEKAALVHDYIAGDSDEEFASVLEQIGRLGHQDLLDFGRLAELLGYDRKLNTLDYPVAPRGYRILGRIPRLPKLIVTNIVQRASAGSTNCSPRAMPSSRRSRASARSVRRTSARAFAGCRRSTSWTAICKREHVSPATNVGRASQGGHHSRNSRSKPVGGRTGSRLGARGRHRR